MRVVISGSRSIHDFALVSKAIQQSGFQVTEVITGGAAGIDTLAVRYANELGLPLNVIHAEWKSYGRAAGPKRNLHMAEMGDALVAIWDGRSRGTANMINQMKSKDKPIYVLNLSQNLKDKKYF